MNRMLELEVENKRYRDALQWYVENTDYPEKAMKALEDNIECGIPSLPPKEEEE